MEEETKTICKVASGQYNIDGETFRKNFINSGGTERMARHIWEKWKIEHHNNFLDTFGNLDEDNQELITKTILAFAKERRYCEG